MVGRSKKPSAIPVPIPTPAPLVETSEDGSRVTATLPTGDSVEVLLYGATVISWKTANGQENLFVSSKAALDGSKAVRGGIPVVFPIFGPPPKTGPLSALSQHGFARTTRWEFLGKSSVEAMSHPSPTSPSTAAADLSDTTSPSVKLDFGLSASMLKDEERKAFPYQFGLTYSVTLAAGSLETVMHVQNQGETAFGFQVLMHTYLKVSDINQISLTGLSSTSYIDKVLSSTTHTSSSTPLTLTSETDRIYTSVPADLSHPVTVHQGQTPIFEIIRDGLTDVVTWNPWEEKAKGIRDFGPEGGWREMVCVEPGEVSKGVTVEGGDAWEGGQVVRSLL
ncbi:MAG: hypothetical protein M1834_006775 [Cirrosporium novae-zelandiae]|nr:MAG: hypothetical protein M1834_006775 [Cirrosporium novae-zelandiae]